MSNAMSVELAADLLLIGLRRLSEFAEAIARMRAGGPEVSEAEVEAAGLAADAAIARAREGINAGSSF